MSWKKHARSISLKTRQIRPRPPFALFSYILIVGVREPEKTANFHDTSPEAPIFIVGQLVGTPSTEGMKVLVVVCSPLYIPSSFGHNHGFSSRSPLARFASHSPHSPRLPGGRSGTSLVDDLRSGLSYRSSRPLRRRCFNGQPHKGVRITYPLYEHTIKIGRRVMPW